VEPNCIPALDDEPVFWGGCRQSLADRGHTVDVCTIGREALEALRIARKGEIPMNRPGGGGGVDGAKGRKILILEAEKSVAEGLQMILEEEGYAVDLALSGRSAMDTLREKEVDLLVADLRLPDMDGMEVVREAKEKRPSTKVIVMTGYPSVSSAVDAMRLGVSDYLPKPLRGDDFKTAVGKVFQKEKNAALDQETDKAEPRRAGRDRKDDDLDSEDPSRPRILIMEDEPSLAAGLKMVLSEQGYRVSVADAGLRALGSLTGRDYDLLLMDLRLPDMDGMEVLRLIKETKPETGVIVMTGYASVASAVESMKLGALDYLLKPFTEDELEAAVEKALKEKKEAAPEKKFAPAVTGKG
jgi:DNA-binding NtrC family response regulator